MTSPFPCVSLAETFGLLMSGLTALVSSFAATSLGALEIVSGAFFKLASSFYAAFASASSRLAFADSCSAALAN